VIEKAIMSANLGLTPRSAGMVIRVPLPVLTEDRRRDLAKMVRQEAEQGRVAIRNVRRDAINDIKELLKDKLINEDQEHQGESMIQELTDKHVAEIERISEEKQKEIMEF
jgi:ribosome recycling factor